MPTDYFKTSQKRRFGTTSHGQLTKLNEETVKWAEGRGISRRTLEQIGAGSGMARMADGQEHASIFFPYRKDGEVVNWKARALNEKLFTQKKGGEQMLFNLESALGGGDVYITEGEMDALSLIEAGIPRAVYALAPLRASRHSHLD